MIDIHCHILPGIDDGARDMAESIELLRIAQSDGIKRIVLTPHIHMSRFENTKTDIFTALTTLKQQAAEQSIAVELAAAAEVRIDALMLPMIEKNLLPFLGKYQGQKFLLLELPHSHIPAGSDKLVKWLKMKNITPVIAHPERNRELLKNPDKVKTFQRLGCWFQLTSSSLTGGFGESCKLLSEKYLNEGLFNIVATDAHNTHKRPPILSKAFAQVQLLCGDSTAEALFISNPYNITKSLFETSDD